MSTARDVSKIVRPLRQCHLSGDWGHLVVPWERQVVLAVGRHVGGTVSSSVYAPAALRDEHSERRLRPARLWAEFKSGTMRPVRSGLERENLVRPVRLSLVQSSIGTCLPIRGNASDVVMQCFQRVASCPTQQIAIVIDGLIHSTPTVQALEFTKTIQISGPLTEDAARSLASTLNNA
jgi:hypothetical protein